MPKRIFSGVMVEIEMKKLLMFLDAPHIRNIPAEEKLRLLRLEIAASIKDARADYASHA
jgi:hypothetical protein